MTSSCKQTGITYKKSSFSPFLEKDQTWTKDRCMQIEMGLWFSCGHVAITRLYLLNSIHFMANFLSHIRTHPNHSFALFLSHRNLQHNDYISSSTVPTIVFTCSLLTTSHFRRPRRELACLFIQNRFKNCSSPQRSFLVIVQLLLSYVRSGFGYWELFLDHR